MIPSLAYNPGLLGRDAVIAQFVARERELMRVLEDIRARRVGHHVLVAGTRGMGKTTLLQRVEAEVARDPALSPWLALKFPEEQYNVRTAADFWVNCLDAMADTFESSGRTDDARALDDAIAALPDDDDAREADALDLLATHAGGRHVLLLVDNLDLLAERVDGWKLRAVLSDPARDLTIVGATSGDALFTADYGKPFLDFFTVVPLDPLSFEEARDLLRKLATRDSATALLDLLDHDEGRFYGLFTLSGGNPRTLIQLYTVLSRPDARERDIEGDLEQLLDQVTPLYKAKFEQLPTQSQQVLDAVAIHWAPVLASSVAESMRMEVTQVSAQLSRLQKLGWIEKVELPDTARAGFQVAERFFNVWYLVRTSRRMRRKLMLLAECLVVLHGKDAVVGHARRALTDPTSRPELLLALSRCVDDASLSRALDLDALDRLAAKGDSPIGMLAAEFEDTPWRSAVENKLKLKGALRNLDGENLVAGRLIASSPVPAEDRQKLLQALAEGKNPPGWFDAVWALVRLTHCYGADVAVALAGALENGDIVDITDRAGAVALRHRSGIDFERVVRIESGDMGDAESIESFVADASAGELIALSRRDEASRDHLVTSAFKKASAEAASAWVMAYPESHAPLPPEGCLGRSAAERFISGRILMAEARHDEAAGVFASVAAEADAAGSFLRDQARVWHAIASSHSVESSQREAARKTLSALLWWPGPYEGPQPFPFVPTATDLAALWRSDFQLVADALTSRRAPLQATFLLLRLHLGRRSFAPYDSFLAESLPAPEAHVEEVLESAIGFGNPVPMRLTEAIGARPGHAAPACVLMLVAGRWDRAADLARQVGPADKVDTERIAQGFEVVLGQGHAERLAAILASTPLGDRMMPYTAAALALAARDERQLLRWPVEVQQPAREIVNRFSQAASPSNKRRGMRPKKPGRKRS
jgi:hypothetical protein